MKCRRPSVTAVSSYMGFLQLQLLQALYGPLGSPIQMSEYSTLAGNIVAAYKAALDSLYAAGARKLILTVQIPQMLPPGSVMSCGAI